MILLTIPPGISRRPWRIARFAAALGAALVLLAGVPHVQAQSVSTPNELRLFRIGTGGPQGTYFPIGNLIAAALSGAGPDCGAPARCGVPNLLAVAQLSNGSVSNVQAISAGVLEAGLVQADVAYWAYSGTGRFEGKPRHPNLRAVATLYHESVHIVVSLESGIRRIAELKGRRVSLDEPGSGTLVDARIVLEAAGLSERDLRPEYIKPQFAAEKLRRDRLDAFFIVAGYPTRSVAELANRGEARLLPIDPEIADEVHRRYAFLVPSKIPNGVYGGIPETPTVSVAAQLLVSADLPDELVFEITRTLWSKRTATLLRQGHAKGREIRLESALDGIAIPLHPGAARFYRQHARTPGDS
ncbi:MAG: TAXI family TRAP transporter solute-binding subunit [Gammaproteobacteria bacterium]|nr:TAXI family TRAP transporter solute-binding subunit [Gammaproteobacteria bacterium]